MNQIINLGHVQPAILSRIERTAKNLKAWWNTPSTTFSAISGEEFTHKQVIIAHAAFLLLILTCALMEKGGAL